MSRPTRGARSAPGRGRLLGRWVGGSLGAAVVVAAVIIGLVLSNGGPSAPSSGPPTAVFAETNHTHVSGTVHYNRNPPAGGPHSAVWLNCGVYAQPVPNQNAVHSIEHGAVWVTYRPGLTASELSLLRQVVESLYEGPQRYVILSPYPGLPAPIVASAWGAQLHVDNVSNPALVSFIRRFEGGDQGGELKGPCSGGIGTPVS